MEHPDQTDQAFRCVPIIALAFIGQGRRHPCSASFTRVVRDIEVTPHCPQFRAFGAHFASVIIRSPSASVFSTPSLAAASRRCLFAATSRRGGFTGRLANDSPTAIAPAAIRSLRVPARRQPPKTPAKRQPREAYQATSSPRPTTASTRLTRLKTSLRRLRVHRPSHSPYAAVQPPPAFQPSRLRPFLFDLPALLLTSLEGIRCRSASASRGTWARP